MRTILASLILSAGLCEAVLAQGGRLVLPFAQVVDNNGDPVSGALWCFDETGTTTDKSVYSDKALSVSLGSTVTADANGRLPSDVYGGSAYKVTVVSGSDCASGTVLAGPWDNVEPKVDFGSYVTATATNTFTGDQNFNSTDGGTGSGPDFYFHRNSPSPASSDQLTQFHFNGEDDADQQTTYAAVRSVILDPTNGSEDGKLSFRTIASGSTGERFFLGAGAVVGNPTGGDQGDGTVNATGYYINGSIAPNTSCYTSAAQTVSADGTLTLAHSLGAAPASVSVYIDNTTADLDYEVGDRVFLGQTVTEPSTNEFGVQVAADTTNVVVSMLDEIRIVQEGTSEVDAIDVNDWSLYVRACL